MVALSVLAARCVFSGHSTPSRGPSPRPPWTSKADTPPTEQERRNPELEQCVQGTEPPLTPVFRFGPQMDILRGAEGQAGRGHHRARITFI